MVLGGVGGRGWLQFVSLCYDDDDWITTTYYVPVVLYAWSMETQFGSQAYVFCRVINAVWRIWRAELSCAGRSTWAYASSALSMAVGC